MPLLDLPNELILNILKHLDLVSCFRLRQTSHHFHHLTTPRILACANTGVNKLAAVYLAATDGDEELIRGLLSGEPNVGIMDNNRLLKWDSPNFTKTLLNQGAKSEIYDSRGGLSLIHRAIHDADEDFIRLLLERGINVNTLDRLGRTPLHVLVLFNNDDIDVKVAKMKLLLEYEADISYLYEGETPLHHAVHESDEIVSVLLECRGDLLMRNYRGLIALEEFNRAHPQRVRSWDLKRVRGLLDPPGELAGGI